MGLTQHFLEGFFSWAKTAAKHGGYQPEEIT
jgi:hypothetical protein